MMPSHIHRAERRALGSGGGEGDVSIPDETGRGRWESRAESRQQRACASCAGCQWCPVDDKVKLRGRYARLEM